MSSGADWDQALAVLGLVATAVVICLWRLRSKSGIVEYPFWLSVVVLGFVAPQLWGLRHDATLPSGGPAKTTVMAILCLMSGTLGFLSRRVDRSRRSHRYDEDRLSLAAAVLTAVGLCFRVLLERLPVEMTEESQWSGLPVAYYFFATIYYYGVAIAAWLFTRRPRVLPAICVIVTLPFWGLTIILSGQRQEALDLAALLVLPAWFLRRKAPPRLAVMSAVVLGTLWVWSIGEYRAAMRGKEVSSVREVAFGGNMGEVLSTGGEELKNAVFTIEAVDRTREFDFGMFHWNRLVSNYVPAQVVGRDAKKSLLYPLEDQGFRVFGHRSAPGSSSTGIADAFGSFWYLGCLEFAVIGAAMGVLYHRAMQGALVSQLLYALMLSNSLVALTHDTNWFLSPFVHAGIFLLPALRWCRADRRFLDKYANRAGLRRAAAAVRPSRERHTLGRGSDLNSGQGTRPDHAGVKRRSRGYRNAP